MRIQTDTTDSTATMTSTAGTAAKTTASTTDFQAIYNSKVHELWEDFAETGLTAADQALKKAGGEEALELKKEIEKRKKASQHPQTAQKETIHKYMPDGSLLTITTKNGQVVEQYRKKPHMVDVPDLASTPPKDPNDTAITPVKLKHVPKRNLLED